IARGTRSTSSWCAVCVKARARNWRRWSEQQRDGFHPTGSKTRLRACSLYWTSSSATTGVGGMTTLRVGVIGVGHLGKEHARILSGLSGVNLAGVADVNAAQAEAIALRCGTKPHSDYRTLLDGIDAAVVAVPTCHHHAVAADVLGRGIPTLVEKPLASTPDEAKTLLALSRAKHVLLQVGHVERFNPAFEALQQRPLTPKYIFGERSGGYTGRSTDIGVVLDLMIHDIDLVLVLVKSSVARVEA